MSLLKIQAYSYIGIECRPVEKEKQFFEALNKPKRSINQGNLVVKVEVGERIGGGAVGI